MAYPARLVTLERLFGRSTKGISAIFLHMTMLLVIQFGTRLDFTAERLADKLATFANAIHDAGAPLTECIGFIDGTARPCARPTYHQRPCYSGHYRTHCLKFQSIVTPDGMLYIYGPEAGSHHDMYLLNKSNVLSIMESEPCKSYCLYGDPGYAISNNICCPVKGAVLLPEEQQFNKEMSAVRISVEWGFGRVCSLWAFVDYAAQLKVYKTPIGAVYKLAVLLTNIRTILDQRNIISDKFQIMPPTLEEYLD
jgi:hypothetical protein